MFSSPTLIFVTDDSCLFDFIGKWDEKKRKYPDGIQILTATQKNVDLNRKFYRGYFDQEMYLKVLAVAVFMVKGILLIKDFYVVNTQ